jgi:SAM-dependent methyltransferase
MGVSGPPELRSAAVIAGDAHERVIWHDLECGGYRADLALWRELADRAASEPGAAPILDVGAGSGRVSLELARAGHAVTAVDLEAPLLAALAERGAGLSIETVCTDARELDLERHDFTLCVVPMQTVQLLGGSAGRSAFLRRAHAHLRPGGVLACAIVTALEPFDCSAGDPLPAAESANVGGRLYLSRPLRVVLRMRTITIERERTVVHDRESMQPAPCSLRDVVELDRVRPARLTREALAAGFTAAGVHEIPPTADHVGSLVVLFDA